MSAERYSIDKYQGAEKWRFGLTLNKALDNINPSGEKDITNFTNKELFHKSILRFEGIKKQPWFDSAITPKIIIDNTEKAAELLDGLRNYFSHFYHTDDILYFRDESPNKEIRLIMEAAYERAKAELSGKKTGQEVSEKDKDGNAKKYRSDEVDWPPLFDDRYKITSAGVVFFASLFTQKSYISRLMGSIEGLKRTDDKFNMTRKALSYYCLPDSYAEAVVGIADDGGTVSPTIKQKAKTFRDILVYLNRIPSETYRLYYQKEDDKQENRQEEQTEEKGKDEKISVERQTDKFAEFSMRYLEDFVEGVKFTRYRINMETRKNEVFFDEGELKQLIEKNGAPEQEKDKRFEDYKYYFVENNAILKTGKGSVRIGINELKYFVLLVLEERGENAVNEIKKFISKFTKANLRNKNFAAENRKDIPPFILKNAGLFSADSREDEIKARQEYLNKKWLEKQKDYKEIRIHDKVGGILRYVNENLKEGGKLDAEQYNNFQKILTMEKFDDFERELLKLEDERDSRTEKGAFADIKGFKAIDDLFLKVCGLVLQKLEVLKGDKLAEYMGLNKQPLNDKKSQENQGYENVLDRYIKYNIALPKGFFRKEFHIVKGLQFWQLSEKLYNQKCGDYVLPLEEKYYKIDGREQFDSDNKKLWEILSKDRICLVMGLKYYEDIRKDLDIRWKKEGGKNVIYADIRDDKDKTKVLFSLKFGEKDYAKMYVIDRQEFLRGIRGHFLKDKTGTIDYDEFYRDGIKKGFGDFQTDVIKKVLMFEEKAVENITGRKHGCSKRDIAEINQELLKRATNIKTKDNRVGNELIRKARFMKKGGCVINDEDIIKDIRNAAFHYQANFKDGYKQRFDKIMLDMRIKIETKDGDKQIKKWKKRGCN